MGRWDLLILQAELRSCFFTIVPKSNELVRSEVMYRNRHDRVPQKTFMFPCFKAGVSFLKYNHWHYKVKRSAKIVSFPLAFAFFWLVGNQTSPYESPRWLFGLVFHGFCCDIKPILETEYSIVYLVLLSSSALFEPLSLLLGILTLLEYHPSSCLCIWHKLRLQYKPHHLGGH